MHIPFSTHTLPNGLRVIHHPHPGSGKVVVNTLYRVGAKHEDPTRTGFAHLFEHLMFEGSRNVEHFDVHVERAGGESNAFTTNDITNYYLSMPANQLETALWLESDRMLELDFRQDKLDVQKAVVCEEFKQRYLNQPYGDAYLRLRPAMFTTHPYRWMTIGERLEHIEEATLDEVKDFFFRFYAPDNATLVIAGDVGRDEALALVEKWYADIPARAAAKPAAPAEPRQTAARYVEASAPGLPHVQVYKAYHIPARAAADYLPADLWTEALAGGKGSKLYQRLVVKDRVAAAVGAFSWGLHDTGKLSINAQLAQGVSPEDYEAALAAALADIAPGGALALTDEEIARLKTKHIALETVDRATLLNRAQNLAQYDCIASPEWVSTELERFQALSPATLEAFRTEYLRPSNCTTLCYRPA
jgi:predicted Zn-dependent peptidase